MKDDRTILDRKAERSILGKIMKPFLHYDPNKMESFYPHKYCIGIMLSLAERNENTLRQLVIPTELAAENYQHEKTDLVQKNWNLNVRLQCTNRFSGKLWINLYG